MAIIPFHLVFSTECGVIIKLPYTNYKKVIEAFDQIYCSSLDPMVMDYEGKTIRK